MNDDEIIICFRFQRFWPTHSVDVKWLLIALIRLGMGENVIVLLLLRRNESELIAGWARIILWQSWKKHCQRRYFCIVWKKNFRNVFVILQFIAIFVFFLNFVRNDINYFLENVVDIFSPCPLEVMFASLWRIEFECLISWWLCGCNKMQSAQLCSVFCAAGWLSCYLGIKATHPAIIINSNIYATLVSILRSIQKVCSVKL